MILQQLARICHEIRLCEAQFMLPRHCRDNESITLAIDHKHEREKHIANTLYNIVKEYALKEIGE